MSIKVLETITLLKRGIEDGLPLPLINDGIHNIARFKRRRLQAAVEVYEEPVDLVSHIFQVQHSLQAKLCGLVCHVVGPMQVKRLHHSVVLAEEDCERMARRQYNTKQTLHLAKDL